ncbi:hypothetical protein [Morganella morganii]|uniref:hypothetical protein n=1 Tax=Morganella morganii TaxID=582 RepID=UPI000469A358|nr:hypothetical protein [Morganella morganii]
MKDEPVIITDMTNEELAQWICRKADYIHRLEALHEESKLQATAMVETSSLIAKYTNLCAMQIKPQ